MEPALACLPAVVNGVLVTIPPPPGYVAAYATGSIGLALALFFVFQRFYVKVVIREEKNKVGPEDGRFYGVQPRLVPGF